MYLKNFKEKNTGPKYLYLDQNFWIYLAQVHYGKNQDEILSRILDKLKRLISNGKLIILLNLTNVEEAQKIDDLQRREKLAKFMILLSKGYSFVPYPYIERLEVENAILEKLNQPLNNIREKAIGKGILYLVSNGTPDFLPKFIASPLHSINETMYLLAKKIMIDECIKEKNIINFILNPRQNQDYSNLLSSLEKIRMKGYEIKDKTLKKKIGTAQYMFNSILPILAQVCFEKKFNPKDLKLYETNKIYDFLRNLPFFYTQHLLFRGLDESPNHKLLSNDILDIRAYSFALPYCDYVIGENYIISLGKRNKLDELYSTKIFRKQDIIEFEDQLNKLII